MSRSSSEQELKRILDTRSEITLQSDERFVGITKRLPQRTRFGLNYEAARALKNHGIVFELPVGCFEHVLVDFDSKGRWCTNRC